MSAGTNERTCSSGSWNSVSRLTHTRSVPTVTSPTFLSVLSRVRSLGSCTSSFSLPALSFRLFRGSMDSSRAPPLERARASFLARRLHASRSPAFDDCLALAPLLVLRPIPPRNVVDGSIRRTGQSVMGSVTLRNVSSVCRICNLNHLTGIGRYATLRQIVTIT